MNEIKLVKLVDSSDLNVAYGILVLKNVSVEEFQRKINEIRNDMKSLDEEPSWGIYEVLSELPEEWDYNYYENLEDVIVI